MITYWCLSRLRDLQLKDRLLVHVLMNPMHATFLSHLLMQGVHF